MYYVSRDVDSVLKSDGQPRVTNVLYERICRFYEILRFCDLPLSYKCRVKFALKQSMNARKGNRGISTLSLTSELGGGGWSTPRPSRFTPWKETRYPLYGRLGGHQCWSGRVRKIWLNLLKQEASFTCRIFLY